MSRQGRSLGAAPAGAYAAPAGAYAAATRPSPRGVRVEAVDWGWRHAGRSEWALRGLDLVIEPGERVLLLGASGSGKSTLVHAMAGLTGPDSALVGDQQGTLLVDGRPAREARDRIGLVAQDPHTQIVMARAGDDVAFGLENRAVPRTAIWPQVDTALATAGFRYGRNRPTSALSGGEKQRLVLAGALALDPGLLLLDEPTALLDSAGTAAVSAVLAGLPSSTTLVLVEHRVSGVAGLVDRVIVVEPGGGIVADGPPGRVFAREGRGLAARGVWVPGAEPGAAGVTGATGTSGMTAAAGTGDGPVIRATGVTARGVLPEVSLALPAGTATAVRGPNGAGKSTLLSLLAGLAPPDRGNVAPCGALAGIDPRPLVRWPARLLARHVGTVFQNAEHQFVRADVRSELRFGPLLAGAGQAEADRRADELLGRLRLCHLASAHPFTLSGGEKRRLSVATALATEPDVLVLDEPTFGQDARTWAELVELMAALRDNGRALVVATHDDRLVRTLIDREMTLPDGRTGTAE